MHTRRETDSPRVVAAEVNAPPLRGKLANQIVLLHLLSSEAVPHVHECGQSTREQPLPAMRERACQHMSTTPQIQHAKSTARVDGVEMHGRPYLQTLLGGGGRVRNELEQHCGGVVALERSMQRWELAHGAARACCGACTRIVSHTVTTIPGFHHSTQEGEASLTVRRREVPTQRIHYEDDEFGEGGLGTAIRTDAR